MEGDTLVVMEDLPYNIMLGIMLVDTFLLLVILFRQGNQNTEIMKTNDRIAQALDNLSGLPGVLSKVSENLIRNEERNDKHQLLMNNKLDNMKEALKRIKD